MRQDRVDDWVRVSKRMARKLHEGGKEVYAIAVKLNPSSPWGLTYPLNVDEPFDKQINEFEVYNCNYECGKYAAFYIKEG